MNSVTGALQVQSMGVASFPLRLSETATITAKYRDEKETEAPEFPCAGSDNEPVAEAGWFCVYRGGIVGGGERTFPGDKNAKFFNILKPSGAVVAPGETGVLGALIAFRSDQFNEENVVKLTAETYLVAGGSWAVTEK
jgi:hypothetical protein